MFQSSNPTLRPSVFKDRVGTGVMTLAGTMQKFAILMLILTACAAVGWQLDSPAVTIGCSVASLVVGLITVFRPQVSPVTAPLMSVLLGFTMGGISVWYAAAFAKSPYPSIVPTAVALSLAVTFVMLGLYATRIIRVTETFRMVVVGATAAIFLVYMVTFIGGFFMPSLRELPIFQASLVGIGFSLFVIVIAALNLALDFNLIEEGVNAQAPKFMEWYGAFGLMWTLVWLYIETLRLLSKLYQR